MSTSTKPKDKLSARDHLDERVFTIKLKSTQ